MRVFALAFLLLASAAPVHSSAQDNTSNSAGAHRQHAQSGVEGLLGKDIEVHSDQPPGRIVDVLVGTDGSLRGAVVEFGGFLGIGVRKVVVPWSSLQFGSQDGRPAIEVNLTNDEIRNLPEYGVGTVRRSSAK